MFGRFERWVALRYLRARREEGFISVIAGFSLVGIALGVATLIIVMAVMNGFRQELLGRILGVNGHLTGYAMSGEAIADYPDLTQRLAALPGTRRVTPQIQGQVMVTHGNQAAGALVRGLEPERFAPGSLIATSIVAGSAENLAEQHAILVGRRLADRYGLRVGDSLTLVAPQGTQTVMGTVPRLKSYPIAGLFELGMYEYDSSFVYMSLADAQKFFRLPDAVNAIEVFVDDPDRIDRYSVEVARELGPVLRLVDWQRANASFFNAVKVERNVMFLILSLIILVAAFNILSGQYMLVKSKTRDIAILRTMGATSGAILRIFFLSGALIGVVGTLAGLGLGIAFAANIETIRQWIEALLGSNLFAAEIYFLSQLPAEIDTTEVVQVVGMALFWSFLAPLFPAWRAARIEPAEALRSE